MENEVVVRPTYQIGNIESMLGLAGELKKLITERKLYTLISGKQYVQVEGWQFAGASLGLVPVIADTKDLSNDKECKYQAVCQIMNHMTGKLVSTGVAICSNREQNKKAFDEYAILSMAQTRAVGKAYRNLLAWLMKAAGFEATPAEEMDFTK